MKRNATQNILSLWFDTDIFVMNVTEQQKCKIILSFFLSLMYVVYFISFKTKRKVWKEKENYSKNVNLLMWKNALKKF